MNTITDLRFKLSDICLRLQSIEKDTDEAVNLAAEREAIGEQIDCLLCQRVNVTYPDNRGNHSISVRDLFDKFSDETFEWLDNFMTSLLNTGKAHSNFGTYQLHNCPVS